MRIVEPPVNIVASLTIEALRKLGVPELQTYESSLISSCDAVRPVFGTRDYGEIYRSAAIDPGWMAVSLITNADAEGDGAKRLRDIACSTTREEFAAEIRQHALDEARHSKWYLSILDLVFPDTPDEELRTLLSTVSPNLTEPEQFVADQQSPFAHEVTLDDLVQMNIAEIRTRIHHMLQRQMLLAHCDKDVREPVTKILDRLLLDETRHIAYTARLIERLAWEGQSKGSCCARGLMHERLRDFNIITEGEINAASFPSCGLCNRQVTF
jgi:rubrerythrin